MDFETIRLAVIIEILLRAYYIVDTSYTLQYYFYFMQPVGRVWSHSTRRCLGICLGHPDRQLYNNDFIIIGHSANTHRRLHRRRLDLPSWKAVFAARPQCYAYIIIMIPCTYLPTYLPLPITSNTRCTRRTTKAYLISRALYACSCATRRTLL